MDLTALLVGLGPIIAAVVTAVATIALWYVTRVLAVETRKMAIASSEPHVVATIEPNLWSMNHFDLHVTNSGNGTAYNVTLSFDPPLPHESASSGEDRPPPLQRMSVLRPGQRLSCYLNNFKPLKEQRFAVTIEWRRSPTATVEANRYTIDMADYESFGSLGDRDPIVGIAQDMRKIRERFASWRQP